MINLRQALVDPESVFSSPQAVLLDTEISRDQKITILKHWGYDVREVFVAEEENMQGKDVLTTFEAILAALQTLDAQEDEDPPPTKQGG
jgi:hypothetical protein